MDWINDQVQAMRAAHMRAICENVDAVAIHEPLFHLFDKTCATANAVMAASEAPNVRSNDEGR